MTVQDNERERELVRLFNLEWDAGHQRSGVDAQLDVSTPTGVKRFQIEVKSTTGQTVSTARDVGMEHILKWQRMIFVIGFYSRTVGRPELLRCLCLTPIDLAPWIDSLSQKIAPDFQIASLASRRLSIKDMYEVCGKKRYYTIEDAKRLHKMQWSAEQYSEALDVKVGRSRQISAPKMLEILRLRAEYIAERGATLNNPHITKSQLDSFIGTDREISTNWAEAVRVIARTFAHDHPNHPAVQSP